MRSFARALAPLVLAAAVVLQGGAQDVAASYADLLERERLLRRELDLAPQLRAEPPGEATSVLIGRIRATIDAYEALARRFPASGYSDNALWQAAVLSAEAFWQFGDARDRGTALRLFALLESRYPSSSLVAQMGSHTTRLNGAAATAQATLKVVRREALPDALRVVLELEREALFHEERLDRPPRLVVDLWNTQTSDTLRNATIPFGDDVVRQARISRQPDNRTRLVFELQGTPRHSVYSLYNPYRIVIDFERVAAVRDTGPVIAAQAPGTSSPPPAAPSHGRAPSSPTVNSSGGFSLSRQLGLGVSRIVIDPGHGGHDPGAQVRGLNEAELVLDVALRLEQLLIRDPGVAAVLTRRTNTYVALEERTAIANRSGADLFLSIHANASSDAAVRGFETYFLNFAPNPAAEAIAARENADSSRTMGSLPDIVRAIAMNNTLDESRDFAFMLQQSMTDQLRRVDRGARSLGVKQAPFMVLVGATMPSALIEVSFLTHRQEATLLRSTAYRQQIAEALLAGILRYQQALKTGARVATQ